ncbi:triacylglycerol lipase [Litoribacillus peritrichatus]|uniref:Triacylglycerol lipase n=1 Tax=Litoribacillus peritrichatus TaxID=718191 RepID=A0ABP7MMI0_9GAMM
MLARFVLILSMTLLSQWSFAGFFFGSDKQSASTKYPIVMVPGAAGFDTALGIDYWYGITGKLRNKGAEVYVTNLSSIQSNEQRSQELIEDLENILAITGAEKVNLIAHSQGALAARYAAAVMPESIASVTTVFGMNRGTHFSNGFRDAIEEGSFIETIGVFLIDNTFNFVEFLSGVPQDGSYNSEQRGQQSILDLAEATNLENVAQFNRDYPQGLPAQDCMDNQNGTQGEVSSEYFTNTEVNGVKYFSWGGVKARTNWLDPIDSVFVTVVDLFMPKDIVWDGLVPNCGHGLGDGIKMNYQHNHFDAINQTLGLGHLFMDIPTLYVQQANRLKNQDL